MATTVLKVLNLISTSDKSWQDDIEKGLERSSKSVRNIRGIDVTSWKAEVVNGKIVEYRTVMKIAFEIEQLRFMLDPRALFQQNKGRDRGRIST
jgi:flavin-binding protein dodecin